MVCAFKSGRMMFKHKNKIVLISRNTIYYSLKFFSLLGGEIGRCPKVTVVACGSPKRPVKWLSQQGQGLAASGHVPGSCALNPQDRQAEPKL